MRIRTGYSFRNSVGMIEKVMDIVEGFGWGVAPISDVSSTFAFNRWKKLAEKRGLRPIFGVELFVTDSPNAKKPSFDGWTFFAKDSIEPINKLIELATNQFRYVPLLTYEQALSVKGVIKIVGNKSKLDWLSPEDEDLFMALSPSASEAYIRTAHEKGLPLIASGDNRYPEKGDKGLYQVLVGRGASTQTYPQWLLSDEEWMDAVEDLVGDPAWALEALLNRERAFDLCRASLVSGELLSPEKPLSLEAMCREGAKKLKCDLSDPIYAARLKRELDLIDEKKFEDYFYIVSDMVKWARERMIVGPARGSSCGSLVCYLLEITTIDPIPFNLIFERFIDINRNDIPDIDIDFSDQKRQLVFDYMAEKYGSNRVARLGTVAMYQPRSAVSEAAGALNIPKWRAEAVLDSLIERSSGDSRALQTLEDTLYQTEAGKAFLKDFPSIVVAAKMEGHPRHYSQHAAGIVLTERSVSEYVAIDSRTGATMCDKKDAEDLNLLKIDALGLTQLSVFEDCLSLIGKPMDFLQEIPLHSQEAFDILNKHHYSGIFQYEGQALQSIVSQVSIDHIEDIIAITALARPGPLASGGTNHWIKVKRGDVPLTYPHPLFKDQLSSTLGVVTYQEQVMQIGRDIGDLSWEDVSALRKAMSKSLGKEFFDKYGDHWKPNAIKKGVPEEVANKIWDDLCAYGAWAFNRSHAVAYGLISYWCCWLKAHHPLEFAAATLTHHDEPEKQLLLLRELAAEGIDYIPVDIEKSTDKWTVGEREGKKILIGPVQNVKGIGPKLVSQIVSSRKRNEPLPPRAEKLLTNPETPIDSLFPIKDAIKRIMPDPTRKNIFTPPRSIGSIETDGTEQEVLVFAVFSKINPRDENELITVQKRGYEMKGLTKYLNLTIADDTGTIFGKVNRFLFPDIGPQILDRGAPGKAIYAIKGSVPKSFRMISVKMVRFIGMINDKETEEEELKDEEQVLDRDIG